MKIGVLTSGGDSPGMNTAIRSVVRQTIAAGHEAIGYYEGYQGLIDDEFSILTSGDVGGIIDRGGTILRTSRCKDFFKEDVRAKVAQRLIADDVALVVIGGDGSFRGAEALGKLGVRAVGIPASIDNDLYGTDFSIGFDTALNTVIDNLSKIRDTASALERVFVVEVMGRQSGAIALYSGLAGGADYIILPEMTVKVDDICARIGAGFKRGKSHFLIVNAEGAGSAFDIGNEIKNCGGYDVKITVLGHIQRGGAPSAQDRLAASVIGSRAVKELLEGTAGVMVGMSANKVTAIPFAETFGHKHQLDMELYDIAGILAI